MAEPATEQIGFLLIPQFSMLSFTSALEPLRVANRFAEQPLYNWHFYSIDDQPVEASNGIAIAPTRSTDDVDGLGLMIVVAGLGANGVHNSQLYTWLRRLHRNRVMIASTSTGSLILARAGLLKKHRCTIHWENKESLEEEFPQLDVTGELYEIDQNIMTCSGGLASLDMMLHKISLEHGESLAMDIAEQFIHPKIRPAHEKQRMELQLRHKTRHPRLLKAIQLMQLHTENVLSCQEIGKQAGLSMRQMERLFKHHLHITPAAFYMQRRLERSNHLLEQSTLTITQIAAACGFNSASYFSQCYQKAYGLSPREERGKAHRPTPRPT